MAYGVTPEGFNRKPLEVIRTEIRASIRGKYGNNVPLDAASVMGQFEGICSTMVDEVWELAQEVYSARDPDAATGAAQDVVGAITGTRREAAKRSTVVLTWTGTPASAIAVGKVAKTSGGIRFQNKVAGVVGGGGTVQLEAESVDYGPIAALAGTINVIETPIPGITAVTNALDATLGAEKESDAAYRIRREQELQGPGRAVVNAIRAYVLDVEGVIDCVVFTNRTDATDGDGLPPHSVEVLVDGGDDEEVRQAVFDATGGGIQTHGTDSGTVTDDSGQVHTIKFSRPEKFDVYVRIAYEYDAETYPVDGDAQVKEAMATWSDANQKGGKDVVPSALSAQAFAVDGVLEVTSMHIATVPEGDPAPTYPGDYQTTKEAMTLRQQGALDTSRITVVPTPGTP